jgi:hypothetical protein
LRETVGDLGLGMVIRGTLHLMRALDNSFMETEPDVVIVDAMSLGLGGYRAEFMVGPIF